MTHKEYNALHRMAVDCRVSSNDYMGKFMKEMKENNQMEMSRYLGLALANESFYKSLMDFLDEYGEEGGEKVG